MFNLICESFKRHAKFVTHHTPSPPLNTRLGFQRHCWLVYVSPAFWREWRQIDHPNWIEKRETLIVMQWQKIYFQNLDCNLSSECMQWTYSPSSRRWTMWFSWGSFCVMSSWIWRRRMHQSLQRQKFVHFLLSPYAMPWCNPCLILERGCHSQTKLPYVTQLQQDRTRTHLCFIWWYHKEISSNAGD